MSKNVPFYSPDFFFLSFPLFRFFWDGHVRTIKKVFPNTTIADVCAY